MCFEKVCQLHFQILEKWHHGAHQHAPLWLPKLCAVGVPLSLVVGPATVGTLEGRAGTDGCQVLPRAVSMGLLEGGVMFLWG